MSEYKVQISFKFNPAGGNAIFSGTDVQVDTLFEYLFRDKTISEFVADFPSVSKSEAVALLEEAAARFDDDVVFDECERRSAEMDAHPERAISQEEFERGLRERFPFLDEKAPKKKETPTP
jgi:uncharacterized protein (DUF433 family)